MNDSEYIKKLESMVDDLTTRLKNLDDWAEEIAVSHGGGYHLSAKRLMLKGDGNEPFEYFVLNNKMLDELKDDYEILSEEYIFIKLPESHKKS